MTEIIKRTTTMFLLLFFLLFLYIFGNNTSFIFFISLISIYSFYEWISISSKQIIFLPIFVILNSVLYYFNVLDTYYLSITALFFWSILIYSMILLRNQLKMFIRKYYMIIGRFIFSSFFLILTNMYPYDNSLKSDSNLIDNKLYFLFFIMKSSKLLQ